MPTPPGSVRETLELWLSELWEYCSLDSTIARHTAAISAFTIGWLLLLARRGRAALGVLGAAHRAGYMPAVDRRIEGLLRGGLHGRAFAKPLADALGAHPSRHVPDAASARLAGNPQLILGPLAMVVRSPEGSRKGVVIVQYNHVFPLFVRLFDLAAIGRRYDLVLEPSWSGYCTPDVLCYAGRGPTVMMQSYEPRDRDLVAALDVGFVPVPVAANWWVDHRVFRPLPGTPKDVDLIMIAGWAPYKRHAQFFRGLRELRRQHSRLRVVLIGYKIGLTREDIERLAERFDVADAIEIYENVSQTDVNVHLNRARVNVLWSRREGVNRAIIEGMFADVPCVLRAGFNYGHPYAYINEKTGAFSSEADLPGTLMRMLERSETMRPREWVLEHMSCQEATRIVAQAQDPAREATDMAVKINDLYGMHYWNPDDRQRFDRDYEFLAGTILPAAGPA